MLRAALMLLAAIAAGCAPVAFKADAGGTIAPPPPRSTVGGGPAGGSDGGASDAGPPPAVPGGSITVPPVCAPSSEVQLTTADPLSGFAWQWDGGGLVVVWATASPSGGGSVHVARFALDGTPLMPATLIESLSDPVTLPTLARVGSSWIVAWQQGKPPGLSVRAHVLDASLTPTGVGSTLIASAASEMRPVLAKSPGGKAALSWMTTNGTTPSVWVAYVDSTLAISNATQISATHAASFPWLSGDGTSLALVYSDDRTGVLSPRWTALGSNLIASGDNPLRTATTGDGKLSRMVRTSTGWLAAWEDTRSNDVDEIYLAITDQNGVRLNETLVEEPNTGDANWPNMAWANDRAAVVYYQFRISSPQIYLSFVDGTGARVGGGADVQVSNAPQGAWARYPDVAWTGSSFAVAWTDTRSGTPQLFLSKVLCP